MILRLLPFLLDNRQSYTISSENCTNVHLLQEGDRVKVTYMDTGESFLPAKEINIEGLE